MKEKLLENKKVIIGLIIVLLLSVSGLTLAYFVGQIGPAATTNVNLTTKTVDNLTFTTGNDITIGPVNQANFAQGSGNKSGSTTAKATLKANTGTNSASDTYNVYLKIKHNNLMYTTEAKTPELKLKVTSPTGTITETDITETNGLITIATDYTITTTSTKTDTWNIEVSFINLNSDQQKNSGRSFAAKVIIQKDAYINGYLRTAEDSSTEYLGYEFNKNEIESINIVDNVDVPNIATLIGDVSEQQNGSILMWRIDNDLYIGQLGGVIANSGHCLFYKFINLTEINGLENLDTSQIRSARNMFSTLSKLTQLDLYSINTKKVTDMAGMFSNNSLLSVLRIDNVDTDKDLYMHSMFYGCSALTELDVSNFNTEKVTNMNWMFYHMNKITKIIVSERFVKDSVATSGQDVFAGDTKLVGGLGTTYNSNHVDLTYAKIDKGPSDPGYFTLG